MPNTTADEINAKVDAAELLFEEMLTARPDLPLNNGWVTFEYGVPFGDAVVADKLGMSILQVMNLRHFLFGPLADEPGVTGDQGALVACLRRAMYGLLVDEVDPLDDFVKAPPATIAA